MKNLNRDCSLSTIPMAHAPNVRASAELNVILYEVLVNRLGINKGDAVRIRVDYEVNNGKVEWLYDTLKVEAFKRVSDEEVERITKETVSRARQLIEERMGRGVSGP